MKNFNLEWMSDQCLPNSPKRPPKSRKFWSSSIVGDLSNMDACLEI